MAVFCWGSRIFPGLRLENGLYILIVCIFILNSRDANYLIGIPSCGLNGLLHYASNLTWGIKIFLINCIFTLRNNEYRRLDLFLLSTVSTAMQSPYLLHLIVIITIVCKRKYKYINGERCIHEHLCLCVDFMLKTVMPIVGQNR